MERLFSALPTPFFGENCDEIDYKSLEKLIDFQVKNAKGTFTHIINANTTKNFTDGEKSK